MADYVSKYTGSQVDGILDEAIELPPVTSADNEKVLKYSTKDGIHWGNPIAAMPCGGVGYLTSTYGTVSWSDLPVPEYNSSDSGKILAVNSTGNNIEWINRFPEYNSSDSGKILAVNGNSVEWINNDFSSFQLPVHNTNSGDYLKYSYNSGVIWGSSNDSRIPAFVANIDTDKVLTVDGDQLVWQEITTLPEFERDDAYKILAVDFNGERLEWVDNAIPVFSTADQIGYVLTVTQYGLDWVDPNTLIN